MWLIIRRSDSAVVGTQAGVRPTAWNLARFEVKEWYGAEPKIHDPAEGVESYDPTRDDPGYGIFADARDKLDELETDATAEIEWLDGQIEQLDDAIPNIPGYDVTQLRAAFQVLAENQRRMMAENRRVIGALRYVVRRLG